MYMARTVLDFVMAGTGVNTKKGATFYRKFSDRYALANSADPDQTAPRGAV